MSSLPAIELDPDILGRFRCPKRALLPSQVQPGASDLTFRSRLERVEVACSARPRKEGVTVTQEDGVEVILEIPKGSRNKYEIGHESHTLWLDRHLFTATTYPTDYGFVPNTVAEDGDPLDVLVLLEEPTVPAIHAGKV